MGSTCIRKARLRETNTRARRFRFVKSTAATNDSLSPSPFEGLASLVHLRMRVTKACRATLISEGFHEQELAYARCHVARRLAAGRAGARPGLAHLGVGCGR